MAPWNLKPLSMCVCVFAVCDEHREFKDMKLFYRFRKDDGTFPLDSEAKVFMRGQRIYEKYEDTLRSFLPFQTFMARLQMTTQPMSC